MLPLVVITVGVEVSPVPAAILVTVPLAPPPPPAAAIAKKELPSKFISVLFFTLVLKIKQQLGNEYQLQNTAGRYKQGPDPPAKAGRSWCDSKAQYEYNHSGSIREWQIGVAAQSHDPAGILQGCV
jgi:hypothetical protein